MRFDLVTLFADLFPGPLATGLVGKALAAGLAQVGYVDPRRHTQDRHRTVDDTPYGGGGGMLMKPEPMVAAIREAQSRGPGPVLLMSPQGRPLRQADLRRWSQGQHLVLVSGRYEGFDERIRAAVDEEVSLGDFVLTGGEYASLVIIDGVVRLLPGTLGNAASPHDDSFSAGLLEHPQYTRPPLFQLPGASEALAVPEVLLSGNHREVAGWRRAQALLRTRLRRPDLLEERGLEAGDRAALRAAPPAGAQLCLVVPRAAESAVEALARAYQLELWAADGPEAVLERCAREPRALVLSSEAGAAHAALAVGPREARARIEASGAPGLLVLSRALAPALLSIPEERRVRLPSLRAGAAENDLPLVAAAAVLLDRLRGEA